MSLVFFLLNAFGTSAKRTETERDRKKMFFDFLVDAPTDVQSFVYFVEFNETIR